METGLFVDNSLFLSLLSTIQVIFMDRHKQQDIEMQM